MHGASLVAAIIDSNPPQPLLAAIHARNATLTDDRESDVAAIIGSNPPQPLLTRRHIPQQETRRLHHARVGQIVTNL